MRRLIDLGLQRNASPQISDGEKITLALLADIHKATVKKSGEIEDPDFIVSAIAGGHYWALRWKYSGIFHDHVDGDRKLSEVVNILDMWSFIEEAYESFTSAKRKIVEDRASPIGKNVSFPGFDGNNESEYMGIAIFLIEKLHRFTRFKGRSLNSHFPAVPQYMRMHKVFEPMRKSFTGGHLTPEQVGTLIRARVDRPAE